AIRSLGGVPPWSFPFSPPWSHNGDIRKRRSFPQFACRVQGSSSYRVSKGCQKASQPFQDALSLYNVFIIPLDFTGLLEPLPEPVRFDLPGFGIENGGILELLSQYVQCIILEIRATPKHQTPAIFLFAVSHNGVFGQKPYRMGMPDLALGIGQFPI